MMNEVVIVTRQLYIFCIHICTSLVLSSALHIANIVVYCAIHVYLLATQEAALYFVWTIEQLVGFLLIFINN